MSSTWSRLLATGLLIAAAGCASTPDPDAPPVSPDRATRVPLVDLPGTTRSVDIIREDQISTGWIDAPTADAWRHLLAVYASLGFEVEDLTEYVPAARRVSIREPRVRRIADKRLSSFLDCGYSLTAPKADQGHVQVFLSTWLEPKDGGTAVTTRFEAAARDAGTSTAAVHCTTKGRLEQLIADQLLLRIVREHQAS